MGIETVQDIVEQFADLLGVYGEQRSIFVSETVERINAAIDYERRLTNREFHEQMVNLIREAIQHEQSNSD